MGFLDPLALKGADHPRQESGPPSGSDSTLISATTLPRRSDTAGAFARNGPAVKIEPPENVSDTRQMRLPVAAILLLAGCAQFTKFTPAHRPVTDETGTTERAAKVLTSEGYTVDTTTPGLVTSTWFVVKDAINSQFHMRWSVVVDGGEVTVDLQCNRDRVGGDNCGDVRPPGTNWQAKADDIATRIAR